MAVPEAGAPGEMLLLLAREALAEAVGEERLPVVRPAWLAEPGASFVTLEIDGELCGCIGSLTPYRSLAEDVCGNATAAALHDPRFPRLKAAQLPRVRVAVSVLSRLDPMEWIDEEDLIRQLRPGVDGLVLEHGMHRGTFLPAVWRQLPEPREFLRQLKRKAGLSPTFWAPDMRISRYTVDSWSEATPSEC
jgi:AmmeMemoRadiSam system protein A